MTKYEFLKERIMDFAGVAVGGAIMAFFMCMLPWGSYGWLRLISERCQMKC